MQTTTIYLLIFLLLILVFALFLVFYGFRKSKKESKIKNSKWTPAAPGQVANFVLFYMLVGMLLAFLDSMGASQIIAIKTFFAQGFAPLLFYSIAYSAVVYFLNKRKNGKPE
jgi:hypothetical protein